MEIESKGWMGDAIACKEFGLSWSDKRNNLGVIMQQRWDIIPAAMVPSSIYQRKLLLSHALPVPFPSCISQETPMSFGEINDKTILKRKRFEAISQFLLIGSKDGIELNDFWFHVSASRNEFRSELVIVSGCMSHLFECRVCGQCWANIPLSPLSTFLLA